MLPSQRKLINTDYYNYSIIKSYLVLHDSDCFVSASETRPWMAVDLQTETAVSTVVVMATNMDGETSITEGSLAIHHFLWECMISVEWTDKKS